MEIASQLEGPIEPGADSRDSSFREKLLEHVFVSELLQEAWLRHGRTLEVLRGEVDFAGYDLAIEYGGVLRHVQLKSSRHDAATARQLISVRLAEKPSGCVVWIFYRVNAARRVELSYRFFGGPPGEKLPPLGNVVAKHTKGDASGVKKERPGLRVINKGEFSPELGLDGLLVKLFGPPPAQAELALD